MRRERETDALVAELLEWNAYTTSVLGEIEPRRVARCEGTMLGETLAPVAIVALDDAIRELAGEVGSSWLRSLDAIHLATALSLGDAVDGFCCYDDRLAADAAAAGLAVVAPA